MPLQDGLGDRRLSKDPAGVSLELLTVRSELAVVPSFEFAVRERVSRLSTFKHPSFARVRGVERGANDQLVLVSEEVSGVRLLDLMAGLETREIRFEIGAALALVRQLLPAVATLHETVRDVAHGALGPERIFLAPNARPVISEYVLGAALEQLLFSRERYWSELGIALPRMAGLPRFDQLTDITQIGATTLALVLGRRLAVEEYPARIGDVLASAQAVLPDGSREPLKPAIRTWIERALQLDPRASFPTAVDARSALEKAIAESGYDASHDRLERLLARYHGVERPAASATTRPPTGSMPIPPFAKPVMAAVPPVAKAPSETMPMPEPVVSSQAHPVLNVAPPPRAAEPARIVAPVSVSEPEHTAPAAEPSAVEHDAHEFVSTPVRRRVRIGLMAVVTAVVVVLSGGATLAAMRYLAAPDISEAPAITGTLVVTSQPTGAQASIDGTVRGATPLNLTLPAGRHTLRLTAPGADARSLPLTIPAGGQVAQHIELGQDALTAAESATPEIALPTTPVASVSAVAPMPVEAGPAAGWIAVSSRFEVKLFEQGQLIGSSQSARIMVPTGAHDLELVNDEIGYRATKSVQVAAGKIASVAIEAPTGTVALNALPWAEVSIDGNKIGETPIGNLSVPVGSHEIVFRHPDLGEKRQTIVVTLKAPARITADLRQP